MTVRVAPDLSGRLARVHLENVPLSGRYCRLDSARRLREKRWEDDLRPDVGYSPPSALRFAALDEAVELVRAAIFPKRDHLVSEHARDEAIRLGRYQEDE